MAASAAVSRLQKELRLLEREPVPQLHAKPLASNLLEWHYVLLGADGSDYEGGLYHGKVIFPPSYPYKPPSIVMLTPSGRFAVNQRLCLSMTDYLLMGLQSFFYEEKPTTGSVSASGPQRRALATASLGHCAASPAFRALFPEVLEAAAAARAAKEAAGAAAARAEAAAAAAAGGAAAGGASAGEGPAAAGEGAGAGGEAAAGAAAGLRHRLSAGAAAVGAAAGASAGAGAGAAAAAAAAADAAAGAAAGGAAGAAGAAGADAAPAGEHPWERRLTTLFLAALLAALIAAPLLSLRGGGGAAAGG